MSKIKKIARQDYDYSVDAEDLPTPIKLTPEEIEKRTVMIMGFSFIDVGWAIACPDCGCVSGISAREDIDGALDWFLKFGCEHYKTEDDK